MISGERKKFAIKARRTVRKKHPMLSNTVVFLEDGRADYCYISFDESLVEFVGNTLPRGIAPFEPAYLFVMHYPEKNVWVVYANYVKGEGGQPLWETTTRPAWLKAQSSGGIHGTTSNPARSSCFGLVHGRSTGGPQTGGSTSDPSSQGDASRRDRDT